MMRYRKGYNSIMRTNRYRPILIILGLLLAVFLLFKLIGVGGLDEESFITQRNAKIRSEMQHAVSSANNLSRLGSTNTYSVLGKIRQYIHGIEVINDLNVSMYGEAGRLYEQRYFENIYTIISTYDAKLVSGQKVNDSLVSLTQAIDELSSLTMTLLDK